MCTAKVVPNGLEYSIAIYEVAVLVELILSTLFGLVWSRVMCYILFWLSYFSLYNYTFPVFVGWKIQKKWRELSNIYKILFVCLCSKFNMILLFSFFESILCRIWNAHLWIQWKFLSIYRMIQGVVPFNERFYNSVTCNRCKEREKGRSLLSPGFRS